VRVFALSSLGDVFSSMESHVKMVVVRMGVLSRSGRVNFERRSKGVCKQKWQRRWRQVLCSGLHGRR